MDFVYLKKRSLDKNFCNKIIDKFNDECSNNRTYQGITSSGLNKQIKDTTDFMINKDTTDQDWARIRKTLENELLFTLKTYTEIENSKYEVHDYKAIPNEMSFATFQIQRYKKNEGKFKYHNDEIIYDTYHRILTYIWYLNDVYEGGETEICLSNKVKPEKGKLLIFPASWLFPHSGNMPISNDKYIITGWIFSKN